MNYDLFKIHVFFREGRQDDYSKKGIYAIVNLKNGKLYVGQTRTTLAQRILQHQGDLLKRNKRENRHLVNSFLKYGASNFGCFVIEYAPENIEFEELIKWLNDAETKWIRFYRTKMGDRFLYNQNDGGDSINPTKEYRNNLSLSLKKAHQEHPEIGLRKSKSQKERYKNPDERHKMSKTLKKTYQEHPELRKQASEVIRKYIQEHPEFGEKVSKGMKKNSIKRSVGTISKIDGRKERYSNFQERNKESIRQKKSYQEHPERKEKQSKSHIIWYKDHSEEFQEFHSRSCYTNMTRNSKLKYELNCIIFHFLCEYPQFIKSSKNTKYRIMNEILRKAEEFHITLITSEFIKSISLDIYLKIRKVRMKK